MRQWKILLFFAVVLCAILVYEIRVRLPKHLDAPFETTHPEVVIAMLNLAQVRPDDLVYDLGCGDGRIVVAAAKQFGARAVGIDIDPKCISQSRQNAQAAGVSHRVRFILGDLKKAHYEDATVVTLYLLEATNLFLRPELFRQLRPGSRVVSHAFDMGDWKPDKTTYHPKARLNRIHLWVIPAPVGGRWRWTSNINSNPVPFLMTVKQKFQSLSVEISAGDAPPVEASKAYLNGKHLRVEASLIIDGHPAKIRYEGIVEGDQVTGKQSWESGSRVGTHTWLAQREKITPEGTWQVALASPLPPLMPGRLTIMRHHGRLEASYETNNHLQPLWDFYHWGASLHFQVPLPDGRVAAFEGFIDRDNISGTAGLKGTTEQVTWSAKRLPQ